MKVSLNRRRAKWFETTTFCVGTLCACNSGSNLTPNGDTTYAHGNAASGRGSDASTVSGKVGVGQSDAATGLGDDASGVPGNPGASEGGSETGPEGDAPGASGSGDAGGSGSPRMDAGDGTAGGGPPVCDPTARWTSPGTVDGLPTGQGATAFTATPDELTVAWLQPSPSADGGIQLYAADRLRTDVPFAPAQSLTAAAAYAASDGITLTPDGLGLVVVRADRMAFAQVARSSRSGAFGNPDETLYQQVNSTVVANPTSMVGPQFAYLGDPVLGQDNLTLMYSGYGEKSGFVSAVSVYESQRASSLAPFPSMTVEHNTGPLGVVYTPAAASQGGPCGTCGVGTDAGVSESSAADAALVEARRHPTGLSSDGRTVFYWDSLAPGTGRAAWRLHSALAFTSSEILGSDLHAIVANATCTRLYFLEEGEFRVAERIQ